jgi:hypothetical protein
VPGEVPERLNGRDWKSRNGGNLVRGFESPPLRPRQMGVYDPLHTAPLRWFTGEQLDSVCIDARAN